jgi:hypothetical protein
MRNSGSVVTVSPRKVSLGTWLEECPNLHMRLIRCPFGAAFPDETSQEILTPSFNENLRVGDLSQLLAKHHQDNIWRSWQLYSDALCTDPVSYVPLVFDIDNEEGNLSDARSLTLDCLTLLERMGQFHGPDRLRIVFSGRKGFHIEGRPSAPLDYASIRSTLIDELAKLGRNTKDASNCFLDGTVDLGHDFIRITGSFNSWRENSALRCRKVIQVSLDEFRGLSLLDILRKSEAA